MFHSREGYDIDWNELDAEELRATRWDKISMVFQGAMNSLNPVISVRDQLEDIFTTHRPEMGRRERRQRCGDLLERVGVDRARLSSYPHELSGGMRQRVMIAMAMALEPQVMIMDEPTTALDVVVQREILRELARLRDELGFAVVFITHDLPLLLEISDRIAVMRRGEIVELGDAVELYTRPQHEYTKQLLASFPSLTGDRGSFVRGAMDDRLLALDAVQVKEATRMTTLEVQRAGQGLPAAERAAHPASCGRSTTSASPSITGRTVALVGQSGSGKSTIAKLLLQLERPPRARSGSTANRSPAAAPVWPAIGVRCRWSSRIRSPR